VGRQQSVDSIVEHLFRNEAGKLVAVLTRIFGPSNIDLAEDVVQETLLAALDNWAPGKIPDNPAAWLTQVAKRKSLNVVKQLKTVQSHRKDLYAADSNYDEASEIFLDSEIQDSQLRMIFTCCHPSLPMESQIALTLKILGGFSIKEIAQALMSNEETITKRLYRAKAKIRSDEIPFDIPSGNKLELRLKGVCLSLYLLFNEGYNSSHPQMFIRKDLCLEAIRLTFLLTQHFDGRAEFYALLALMCFHAARLDARLDREGAIVIFEDQDRSLWNHELISKGFNYLREASKGDRLSEYHLEAGIAAEHCMAKDFKETNWQSIYDQYELLYGLKKNPIIKLNMAIISSQLEGIPKAIHALEELISDKELETYYFLYATLGVFNLKIKDYEKAGGYLSHAKSLTSSEKEQQFLNKRILECQM